MEELQLVKDWLCRFPLWDTPVQVDSTEPTPGSRGLFPVGQQVLWRREDLLGNVRCRYRSSYLLRRSAPRGEAAAAELMEFARWACSGDAPVLGENQTVRAEKGRLLKAGSAGMALYEITIIMEYEKEN